MFTGLSAFPLTPVSENDIDGSAFSGIVARLDREQRRRLAEVAVRPRAGPRS